MRSMNSKFNVTIPDYRSISEYIVRLQRFLNINVDLKISITTQSFAAKLSIFHFDATGIIYRIKNTGCNAAYVSSSILSRRTCNQ